MSSIVRQYTTLLRAPSLKTAIFELYWAVLVHDFIIFVHEEIYFKRFKKNEPERVLSIEEQAEEIRRKQAEKKERKRLKRAAEFESSPDKVNRQGDE